MAEYTKYMRGSEWRKWDLHIHTPETKKNDQFLGATIDEKWEMFIDSINNSTEEIAVVGITDYFCVDNYFKFKNIIADGKITKEFNLIIPNIEIRVLPVTGSSTPINLHCIFNPSIDSEIETRFLSKLKFSYSGSNYSAKKEELIRLGKALPGNSILDDVSALKAGIGQYVISIETLSEVFEKDGKLRDNTVIVVSNRSTDGASGIRKHSDFFINTNSTQLDATRWSIYQFSDAIFSSNENDVLYFLGLGPDLKDAVIEKCKTLMPCFHGCDAHTNDKVFKPDGNKYCWIKADPTFEGLKQTLYEPEDRVKIQALKPDVKNERYVISKLHFVDSNKLFGNHKILLNDNLNAIIGGKSSGKSLLLYSIANSIDPEQVGRISKRLRFEGYNFDEEFDFVVTWKNGTKDILSETNLDLKYRKITYIPQLYINYLAEKNNKVELNTLIQNILLQDSTFKSYYEQKIDEIVSITEEINNQIINFLSIRSNAILLKNKIKDNGTSEAISESIKNINIQIDKGKKLSNLTDEDSNKYSALTNEKEKLENQLQELQNKELILNKILQEVLSNRLSLIGEPASNERIAIKGQIDRVLDEMTEIPDDILAIKDKLISDYTDIITKLKKEIEKLNLTKKIKEVNDSITINKSALVPFLKKFEGQLELRKLTIQLEKEISKKGKSENYEKQFKIALEEYKETQKYLAELLSKRYNVYKEIENTINTTKNEIDDEIMLNCSLIFRKDEFLFFEQVNKAAIAKDHYFNTLFNDYFVNYELVPNLFASIKKIVDEFLLIKDDESVPLKQKISIDDIFRGLTKDAFEFDYKVTYKQDELLQMSPGKKGTVLLILFLQISSAEYPILIDQPEDNLDNRTIYDLLCKIIKDKKKSRQIIIVSHNANLVVATDSENIIVANQLGQESILVPGKPQFEYVNGSLENSSPKDESEPSILLSQGIREHVCDILEGGGEAFKQRERKYSIK